MLGGANNFCLQKLRMPIGRIGIFLCQNLGRFRGSISGQNNMGFLWQALILTLGLLRNINFLKAGGSSIQKLQLKFMDYVMLLNYPNPVLDQPTIGRRIGLRGGVLHGSPGSLNRLFIWRPRPVSKLQWSINKRCSVKNIEVFKGTDHLLISPLITHHFKIGSMTLRCAFPSRCYFSEPFS